MAELRRDPIVGRWIIVNTDNPKKPDEFEKERHVWGKKNCPFCYGNEKLTPPEITAIRPKETKPDTPGWTVRVVPNKFPALDTKSDLDKRGMGIFDMSNGFGRHEVIIETPEHNKTLTDLNNDQIYMVLKVYCQRSDDLHKDRRFKYILIFKNYGASAGASLEHNHTQLIALPMIPKNVAEEIKGSSSYHDFRERCIFCDTIQQEIKDKQRIVLETESFISFCPFISRFTFEVRIMPKRHNPFFAKTSAKELKELAIVLKETLLKIKNTLSNPAYNFMIYTFPFNDENGSSAYHWHIEIIPRLTRIAGFEWGTGFYFVSTPPELAAKYLREATTYGTK